MLFRGIESYLLKNSQKRLTPHLHQYIETLNIRRGIVENRYLNSPGYESNIVVLLRKILADADIPSLLKKPSDLDCYFDKLIYDLPSLNSIFDSVTTGLTFHDMVISRSSVHTEEFLIPVSCQDPVSLLPFDQGWDAWQNVKPIRLVDIDSLELTFHTYQDQIVFSKIHPTRAVITIDIISLVLQYVNFLRTTDQELSQPEYIHRYVLVYLLSDLQDIWLMNVYTKLLESPIHTKGLPSDFVSHVYGDRFYGYIGSELTSALRELNMLMSSCRDGNLTPAVLLASLPLSSSPFPDYMTKLLETTSTSERRQDYWLEYLRDVRFLNILLRVYQLQPEFITTNNLRISLRRDLPLLYNSKFWNSARSSSIRSFIETDIKKYLDIFK